MLRQQRIFLIGLPLSGKSSLGAALAAALACPFLDLDAVVCATKGIAALGPWIQQAGEASFRKVERACLQETLRKGVAPFVLACGGGTPCYFDQIQLLKQAGRCVYLRMSWTQLHRRVKASASVADRPLLAGLKHPEDFASCYAHRLPIYAQADTHFDVSDRPLGEQRDLLLSQLKALP